MRQLVLPSPNWIAVILEALKKGAEPVALSQVTGIGVHWIRQFFDLGRIEENLSTVGESQIPASLLQNAVKNGFSAKELSLLAGVSEKKAEQSIKNANLKVGPCSPRGKEGETSTAIFNTLSGNATQTLPTGKTVLLVGPGPGRIGQSIEMDHCCSRGAKALHAAGRRVALVNGNPGSACGLKNVDRTYVEPLALCDIKSICAMEKPDGVILQFGGYRSMTMAKELSETGYTVLGTSHEQVALTQDRLKFNRLLKDLGIAHTQMGVAKSPEQALDMAESIGYPLMARPQGKNKWRKRTIIMEPRMMENYVKKVVISADSPILLEQFLEYAIEVEADALCDGNAVYVPAVMEHIELAGVHSGDAAMVIPPYSTPPRHVETITAYIQKIALKIGTEGIINTRFAVYNDTVYLLEARPWACRTLPMVSKMCNIPMAERAVEIMLGMRLEEMDLPRRLLPHYGIRASVFPYDTFRKTDPLLGPRMRSTGQAMVFSEVFGMAYFTAQEAAGSTLPLSGDVLITVTDEDKPSILEPARLYSELGFGIRATRGTYSFLRKNGIDAKLVKKVGFGRPDLVDGMKTGEVALVVNTPSGRQSHQDDAYIRNTAIRYGIPNITTPAGALASAKGIAARIKGQDALCTLQSYVRAIK
jgi:carbamoyl-phosphate synthase large subunit